MPKAQEEESTRGGLFLLSLGGYRGESTRGGLFLLSLGGMGASPEKFFEC